MSTTIIQTGEKTFTADNGRGTTMILQYREKLDMWSMMYDNAARQAWGTVGLKYFHTLSDVESKYKTWRGISALIAS